MFIDSRASKVTELSIVIVSYNTREITLDCLESVYRHPPSVPFEVILLDNASSDGSYEAIHARFPQVQAIAHPENVGFAAGNNIAAERATGRRILLLNPDTIVFEKTLDGIWDFAEREPGRGIWGGRTVLPDGRLDARSCWRRITLWSLFCNASGLTHLWPHSRIFNSEIYGDWQRDEEREVDIVTGCFLLIDGELWRRLGGFDRTFFMYAEEADLCLRARALGARPAITPKAELIHLGGQSEISSTEALIKIMRGRFTLIRKHWSPAALAAARALMLFWAGTRVLGSRFRAGRQDDPATARQKWRTVWERRHEWLAGYPSKEGAKG